MFFFFFFLLLLISPHIFSLSPPLSLSLSGVWLFLFFCFWLKDFLIFVWRRGLRHPAEFPPLYARFCVYACWVRVTKYFRWIMFWGGEMFPYIWFVYRYWWWKMKKKNNRQCLFSFSIFLQTFHSIILVLFQPVILLNKGKLYKKSCRNHSAIYSRYTKHSKTCKKIK